jgi:hypothetical protein
MCIRVAVDVADTMMRHGVGALAMRLLNAKNPAPILLVRWELGSATRFEGHLVANEPLCTVMAPLSSPISYLFDDITHWSVAAVRPQLP